MEATQVIDLTEKAQNQVLKIYKDEDKSDDAALRVGVVGGGCSGLSYKIEFSEIKENDHIIKKEGLTIVIDPKSSIYLQGTTLDFQDGLEGKGFVFVNPSAKNTCGCGESFSI